jgi:hypothetical protein
MKNGVFWDVTSCGFCKNRRFEGDSTLRNLLLNLFLDGETFLRNVCCYKSYRASPPRGRQYLCVNLIDPVGGCDIEGVDD